MMALWVVRSSYLFAGLMLAAYVACVKAFALSSLALRLVAAGILPILLIGHLALTILCVSVGAITLLVILICPRGPSNVGPLESWHSVRRHIWYWRAASSCACQLSKHSSCVVGVWWVCGCCVVGRWLVCGGCVVGVWCVWWVCGWCVVGVWLVCGWCVVGVWLVCGWCV